jgi:GNAT superfamily N-acetyltransferase
LRTQGRCSMGLRRPTALTRGSAVFRLRAAGIPDLPLLVRHRLAMWKAIHRYSEELLRSHAVVYRRWARKEMRAGRLFGWIATDRLGRGVGSGCLWLSPAQPRISTHELEYLPYILSMYTEPRFRGNGIAESIVRAAVAWSRRQGYPRITLHAAPRARPLYVRLGFERSWEMRQELDPAAAKGAVHRPRTGEGSPAAPRVGRARSPRGRRRSARR